MEYPKDFLNKIIQGDCLEVMKQMPDKCVDLVLTDPPYGVKMDKGFEGFGGFGKPIARKRYEEDDWDSERPSKEYFDEILRIGKRVIIFGGNFFADLLPPSTHWLVWDKENTMPSFGDAELVWTNSERKSVKILVRQYNGLIGKETVRQHPTQKPVDLIERLIRDYSEGGGNCYGPLYRLGDHRSCSKKFRSQLYRHRNISEVLRHSFSKVGISNPSNDLNG